jgi:flagellar biosynthesis chaperone FliJ
MKRFTFTLQAVKDLREDREQAALEALAGRLRAHASAQTAAERSRARHAAAEDGLRRTRTTGAVLVQADRDRDAARLGLETATLDLSEKTFAVGAARRDVTEAKQAVDMLAKLETRKRDEHVRALLAEEERQVAEIIEARAARRATARRVAKGRRAA